MPESEVTLGELSRNIATMRDEMNGKFIEVNRRLDSLEFVPRREFEAVIAALVEDVKELKDDKTWTRRALVASLLLPIVVGLVLAWALTVSR